MNSFELNLQKIEGDNGDKCLKIFLDHKEKMEKSPWSKTKHQAWEWWYVDHLNETMMFAEKLYEMSIALWRPLPFRLSDAFLTLFLHDLEKPWKYGWTDEDVKTVQSFSDPKDFIFYMAKKYGIQLSEMHINAIQYVHWEGVEYNPDLRIQQPLAAFIHVCDVMSARVYFDYPKKI